MSKFLKPFFLLVCVLGAAQVVFPQKIGKVISKSNISGESVSARNCKDLRLGQILTLPEAKYPAEARNEKLTGSVEVTVNIDENGNVSRVENVSGNKILQGAAIEAALKAKFIPTLCDGKKARVSGTIVFNFYPYPSSGNYFSPAKAEDFADFTKDSEYFQAIFDLTETYKIGFGYADGKFHPEAPLTRGDFAHFLRLTLEIIAAKSKDKRFFSAYNPNKISSIGKIKDLKSKEPFYESVKILLQNYDVAIINESSEFRGGATILQNEIIEIWTNIFGADAIPVNFQKTDNYEKIVSRGEFSLFLDESLGVLMYKISS